MKYVNSKVVLLPFVLGLAACSSASDSSEKPKFNQQGTCISEESLEGIVGGQKVGKYDADSNRVVMLLSESADGIQLCTAAPIAPDVLLTAAHCVVDTDSNSKIKAFATTSATCESGFNRVTQGIDADAVVFHENYRSVEKSDLKGVKSDIALVFLKSSLPAQYPVYKIADSQRATDSSLYLFGFGTINMTKKSAGVLRKTEVRRGRFEINRDLQEVAIDQTYGQGVCTGDSGGPGLIRVDGEYQILGVNSYASGRKGTDQCLNRGNLTLVDYYLSWIEGKMATHGRSLRR